MNFLNQPFGTKKGQANQLSNVRDEYLSNEELFLSVSNSSLLSDDLFTLMTSNNSIVNNSENYEKTKKIVKKLQLLFTQTSNLSKYEVAEYQTTSVNDYTLLLSEINEQFTKFAGKYLNLTVEENPFRTTIKSKNPYELTSDDKNEISYWKHQFVSSVNSKFRDNNQIPKVRQHLHVRHLDRSNEGLTYSVDHSSVSSYSSSAYKYATADTSMNYSSENWF